MNLSPKASRAGEDALRAYAKEQGISLVVVSGDAIEGTITPKLLQRKSRGRYEASPPRPLPTVEEFAEAIAQAAADGSLAGGQTIFVGSTEW